MSTTTDPKLPGSQIEYGEKAGQHIAHDDIMHGDRALKLLGDERIEVTAEDVRLAYR